MAAIDLRDILNLLKTGASCSAAASVAMRVAKRVSVAIEGGYNWCGTDVKSVRRGSARTVSVGDVLKTISRKGSFPAREIALLELSGGKGRGGQDIV